MASFKSNTQIPLEIDGHQFVIDGISKTVMTAVQMITRQSAELAAQKLDPEDNAQLLEQVAVICKDFLASVLGLVGYEELMSDRVDDVAYLSDVCQYILQEITAAKTARINRMMGRS